MKKIYIDCGAYKGVTVKAFCASVPDLENWEIYAFEPNPYAKIHKHKRDYTVLKKAVWIEDTTLPFYINKVLKRTQAPTLIKEKISGGLNKKKPLMVDSVDFGKWIIDNFKRDDTIVVKMDIEGAEYKVLPSMIKDGSINYVNVLYLETHWDRIAGMDASADEKLYAMLAEVKTLNVCDELIHLIRAGKW